MALGTRESGSLNLAAPLHVQIELTWKCNWRCVHCYQETHTAPGLPSPVLNRLFDELRAAGALHIIVTGGEPLSRKDIFGILESIRRRGFAITLYSNGSLIDDATADRLSAMVSTVEISILAGDAQLHDTLAGAPGSYVRAMAAVRRLVEREVEVVVKTPILRPAYSTLKALESTLAGLGVEWIAEPEISRSYSGETYPLDYKMSKDELRRYFVDFPQFRPQMGKSPDPGVRDGMCLAARQHCFIDVFGNVYPCLNFKSASDVNEARGDAAGAKMGNVLRSSFEAIWNSPIGTTIRAADRSSFTTCGGCEAAGSCRGCMALNYEQHGELFRPSSIVCGLTQAAWHQGNPEFIPAGMRTPGPG